MVNVVEHKKAAAGFILLNNRGYSILAYAKSLGYVNVLVAGALA